MKSLHMLTKSTREIITTSLNRSLLRDCSISTSLSLARSEKLRRKVQLYGLAVSSETPGEENFCSKKGVICRGFYQLNLPKKKMFACHPLPADVYDDPRFFSDKKHHWDKFLLIQSPTNKIIPQITLNILNIVHKQFDNTTTPSYGSEIL